MFLCFFLFDLKIPDESYIQTVLAIEDPENVDTRSVLYVHWGGAISRHPASYTPEEINPDFIRKIQQDFMVPAETIYTLTLSGSRPCTLAGQRTHCFLFARKFEINTIPAFL
ncbi:unnamed protein product, partial [Closterium sp. NIES-53]